MKKTLGLTACAVTCLMVNGCGGMDQQRWDAWKEIEVSRNQAIQEKKDNGGIQLSFTDSGGKPVNFSVKFPDFGSVCEKRNTVSPMPKGMVAEALESTGYLIREVGHAPATLIWATGEAIVGVMASGGGGTKIDAEEVSITDSFNDTNINATGEGNSSSFGLDRGTDIIIEEGEE